MIEYTVKVFDDSARHWRVEGKLHREDGPAIENADGSFAWYFKGKLHREDGPAIERSNGQTEWYLHGNRHRADGPAVENANGLKAWWLKGHRVTEQDVMGKTEDYAKIIAKMDVVVGEINNLRNELKTVREQRDLAEAHLDNVKTVLNDIVEFCNSDMITNKLREYYTK